MALRQGLKPSGRNRLLRPGSVYESPARVSAAAQNLLAGLPLRRRDQIDVAYAQSHCDLIDRDDRGIGPARFHGAEILLRKAAEIGEFFLRETLFEPDAPEIGSDQLAHIHAPEVTGLHEISLSGISCTNATDAQPFVGRSSNLVCVAGGVPPCPAQPAARGVQGT